MELSWSMVQCWIGLFGIWSVLLGVTDRVSPSCNTDCLSQAGVPCEIVTNITDCPQRPMASRFPGLPQNVKFMYYIDDTVPQLNVTWSPPEKGLEFVKAFEINYWSYIHNPDPDATKGPDGEFGVCVQYNMTRGIHPESHSSFYHDCVHSKQHYITLASLPQQYPDLDYVHRVVATFQQDYGDSTALWQPALVVIHNDSCHQMVEIQLDLAPEHFGFEYYRVALRYADDRFNDANFTEFMVKPGVKEFILEFTDVPNGEYVIKIYPEPDDRGDLCHCPDCWEGGCHSSKTGAFIMDVNHPKCQKRPMTQHTRDPPVQITVSVISVCIVGLFLIVAAVLLKLRLSWRKKKTDSSGKPKKIDLQNQPCMVSRTTGEMSSDDRIQNNIKSSVRMRSLEPTSATGPTQSCCPSHCEITLQLTDKPYLVNTTDNQIKQQLSKISVYQEEESSLGSESYSLDGILPPRPLSAIWLGATALSTVAPEGEDYQDQVSLEGSTFSESGIQTMVRPGYSERFNDHDFFRQIPMGKRRQEGKDLEDLTYEV